VNVDKIINNVLIAQQIPSPARRRRAVKARTMAVVWLPLPANRFPGPVMKDAAAIVDMDSTLNRVKATTTLAAVAEILITAVAVLIRIAMAMGNLVVVITKTTRMLLPPLLLLLQLPLLLLNPPSLQVVRTRVPRRSGVCRRRFAPSKIWKCV
jgi:hypothetical protein